MCLILCKYTQFLLYFKSVYGCDFGWFVLASGLGLGTNLQDGRMVIGHMAIGQLKVFVLCTYGVTNAAADRTSPDRGK
jgi:hypothetical protein